MPSSSLLSFNRPGALMSSSKAASQVQFDRMYDIVGSLPLELLIYVAEYLSLEDIVRNQRVCSIMRIDT